MKKISEEEYKSLKRKIWDSLPSDSEFPGELETEELLERLSGYKANCYDHYIDDGCDEGEDEYIMCAAYEIKDTDVYVRVYYGDNTGLIGYVEVTQR